MLSVWLRYLQLFVFCDWFFVIVSRRHSRHQLAYLVYEFIHISINLSVYIINLRYWRDLYCTVIFFNCRRFLSTVLMNMTLYIV